MNNGAHSQRWLTNIGDRRYRKLEWHYCRYLGFLKSVGAPIVKNKTFSMFFNKLVPIPPDAYALHKGNVHKEERGCMRATWRAPLNRVERPSDKTTGRWRWKVSERVINGKWERKHHCQHTYSSHTKIYQRLAGEGENGIYVQSRLMMVWIMFPNV